MAQKVAESFLPEKLFHFLHNKSSHASSVFSMVCLELNFGKPSCSLSRSMRQCEIAVIVLVIYAYILLPVWFFLLYGLLPNQPDRSLADGK